MTLQIPFVDSNRSISYYNCHLAAFDSLKPNSQQSSQNSNSNNSDKIIIKQSNLGILEKEYDKFEIALDDSIFPKISYGIEQ
jgi:hypothetical protein